MSLIKNEIYYDESGEPVQVLLKAKNARNNQDVVVYQMLSESFSILVLEDVEFSRRFLKTKKVFIEQEVDKKVMQKDSIFETVESDIKDDVNKDLLRFLDTNDYQEKINILTDMKGKMDNRLLNNLAVSMDVVLNEGTEEEKLESLMQVLMTQKRFEGKRLR